jgi:hypothetical protein
MNASNKCTKSASPELTVRHVPPLEAQLLDFPELGADVDGTPETRNGRNSDEGAGGFLIRRPKNHVASTKFNFERVIGE